MFSEEVRIGSRRIGGANPPFVIGEISANHGGSLESALRLVNLAAKAGVSAVKFQHYTPETITIRSNLPEFRIGGGTLWDGRELFDLYAEAMTPWEWTAPLFAEAERLGLICFSSPFDVSAVDFLEKFEPAAYKVASFELVDLPLIRYIASTGRPMIMSTGMASLPEIDAAVDAAQQGGCRALALLRCNSGYPAEPSEMDLAAIPVMKSRYGIPVGLSDHTLGNTASIVAAALGASIFEKHIIEKRLQGGPDAKFSIEPDELEKLIQDLGVAFASIGKERFGPSDHEMPSMAFRRSLRVTRDLHPGDVLGEGDVRSMRPAGGLSPDLLSDVIGRRVRRAMVIGQAVSFDDLEERVED